LSSFKREYAFSTWLFRIATNHAIDFLRKKQLATQSMQETIETQSGEITQPVRISEATPEAKLIQKEATSHIALAIEIYRKNTSAALSCGTRKTNPMRRLPKYSNLPLGTVKARIFRAREMLNKELKDILES
jgi:RNA polymerase sigma factor (sigma-70 family)